MNAGETTSSQSLDERVAKLLAADPKLAATREALREKLLAAHWMVREEKEANSKSLK